MKQLSASSTAPGLADASDAEIPLSLKADSHFFGSPANPVSDAASTLRGNARGNAWNGMMTR